MKSGRVPYWLAILALLGAWGVLYLPSLSLGFLSDDYLDLGHSFGPSSFSSFQAGGFRPLQVAVWAFDSAVYGVTRAWGWHLTNVLLHTANVALMFFLLRSFGIRRWVLLGSVAFFALSFAAVPSVCRVSGRTTVAALAPLLGAMILHVKWKEIGKPVLLAGSLLLVLVSLLFKETALACPLVFATLTAFSGKKKRRGLGVLARDFLLYLIPIAVYLAWRVAVVGTQLGYAESSALGPYIVRNLAIHGAAAFAPWMSGLSARLSLLVLLLAAWLLRSERGLSPAGLLVMLGMLLTVSNLPPRTYYTYAALPGAAMIFAGLARACSRRFLAVVPVVLILGSFLAARDEAGRVAEASAYTEGVIGHLVSLDGEVPGTGPIFISGIEGEVAGYGTLWPNTYDEAIRTRGTSPDHLILDREGFWEGLLLAFEDDSAVVAGFAHLSDGDWNTVAFRPAERYWGDREVVMEASAVDGIIHVTDSVWLANSCEIVSPERCSLALIDPLTGSLSRITGEDRQGSEGLIFDLESSSSWLLAEPPFTLLVLGADDADQVRVQFTSNRLWIDRVRERLDAKAENLRRLRSAR